MFLNTTDIQPDGQTDRTTALHHAAKMKIMRSYIKLVWERNNSDLGITGSALALHCCKAHAKINRKIENSIPLKS